MAASSHLLWMSAPDRVASRRRVRRSREGGFVELVQGQGRQGFGVPGKLERHGVKVEAQVEAQVVEGNGDDQEQPDRMP